MLLMRIAAGQLDRTLMGADDIAEGIELGGCAAEGEGTERRLEQ